MKLKLLTGVALLVIGSVAAHAQYTVGDLIATFENPAGNDLEINLGLESTLATTPGAVTDFGNVSSYLSTAGLTTSSPFSVIGAIDANSIKGGATVSVSSALGTITALPQTLVYTENDGLTPSFVGKSAAQGTSVYNAFNNVGGDISSNGTGGVAIVNAAADTQSYTSQVPSTNVSTALQTTTPGAQNYLYLLTSQTPGTTGKSGVSEGPYTGSYELGYFSISSGGELTFTAIPEPSTYAAILGALTLGVAAIRRRRSAIV